MLGDIHYADARHGWTSEDRETARAKAEAYAHDSRAIVGFHVPGPETSFTSFGRSRLRAATPCHCPARARRLRRPRTPPRPFAAQRLSPPPPTTPPAHHRASA